MYNVFLVNSKLNHKTARINCTTVEFPITAKTMASTAEITTSKVEISKALKIADRSEVITTVIKHGDLRQKSLWTTSLATCHKHFSHIAAAATVTICQKRKKRLNHLSQQSESKEHPQSMNTLTNYTRQQSPTTLTYILFGVWLPTALLLTRVQALANCPNSCQCNDNTLMVKCGEGALDDLPITLNPSITHLIIKSNKIKTIDSPIQFYTELTFLDLSYNDLITIPQRTFAFQRKLLQLHLNHNKIGQVNNKTFIGLGSLEVLNLRGNLLAELNDGAFSSLNKVKELNVGQNRISHISQGALDGLLNLKVLYLDDNTLTTVPASITLRAVLNLEKLYLGTNSFLTIPTEIFSDLKGLTVLDLKGAGLHNMPNDSLKGLENLLYLDLSDNYLQQIPQGALLHLERLEYLSLGQNYFEEIPSNALLGLKNLKRLEITGAQHLKRISNSAFSSNTKIEYLNLSENKMLSEIQENAFAALPYVKHIILKNNHIITLKQGLFPWSDLLTLDLSGNPLHCDCNILWLRMLMVAINGSNEYILGVMCFTPPHLKGELLNTITPANLGCVHSNSHQQFFLGVLFLVTAATITILVLVIYTCRKRIQEILKGSWGSSTLGRKEREYQKTFSDEDCTPRQPQLPCSLSTSIKPYTTSSSGGCSQHTLQYMDSKPIPVTEL